MRRLPVVLLLAGLAAGCTQDDVAVKDRIDRLMTKAEALDRKITALQQGGGVVGGAAAPSPQPAPPPRPAGPDPSIAYSVPIEGDPTTGPATAKVTIVEAADFA